MRRVPHVKVRQPDDLVRLATATAEQLRRLPF
jgi:hypothetical protein